MHKRSTWHLPFLVIAVLISGVSQLANAAPVSLAEYSEPFKKLANARSETLAIMGGDDGISGGTYKFYDDGTSMNLTKLGGSGTFDTPHTIGNSSVTWQPQLGGNIGYISGENPFKNNPILLNNTEKFSTFALGLEGGLRLNLTEELSLGAMLGLIYAHSDSRFEAGTDLGVLLKQRYSGQLFDWYLDTLSLVPSCDIQYQRPLGKDLIVTLSSRFAWFNTWDLASSSDYLRGNGSSYDWETKADLDLRLPVKLLGFPLHTGVYAAVDILGNDFRDTVGTNAMYTVGGRLVLGDLNGLWKLNWIGLGAAYFKADTFYGYSVGLDARFKF